MTQYGTMKIGFALGSGGARGYCHVGVLKALEEEKIYPDMIAGCSMGALVGGAYAVGVGVESLEQLAVNTAQHQMMDFDILLNRKLGFLKGERVLKLIRSVIPQDLNIEDLKIPYCALAVDLRSGELLNMNKGLLGQAIRASISIPTVFQPIEVDDYLLVDGGLVKRVPVSECYGLGADFVLAVDAVGPLEYREDISDLLDLIERCLNISDWRHSAKYAPDESDFYVSPDLGVRKSFVFKRADEAIEIGYDTMKKKMPQLKLALEKKQQSLINERGAQKEES